MEMCDILTASKWAITERKLSRFRRHPDWIRAFKKVVEPFVIELPDGRRGIRDEDKYVIFEMADDEFVDDIIRHEKETA